MNREFVKTTVYCDLLEIDAEYKKLLKTNALKNYEYINNYLSNTGKIIDALTISVNIDNIHIMHPNNNDKQLSYVLKNLKCELKKVDKNVAELVMKKSEVLNRIDYLKRPLLCNWTSSINSIKYKILITILDNAIELLCYIDELINKIKNIRTKESQENKDALINSMVIS